MSVTDDFDPHRMAGDIAAAAALKYPSPRTSGEYFRALACAALEGMRRMHSLNRELVCETFQIRESGPDALGRATDSVSDGTRMEASIPASTTGPVATPSQGTPLDWPTYAGMQR